MKGYKYFKRLSPIWDVVKLEKSLQEVLDITPFPSSGQIINHHTKITISYADSAEGSQVTEHNIEKEIQNLDTVVNQLCLTKKPESTSDYFRIKLKEQKQNEVSSNNMRENIGELDGYLSELDYTEFIPEFNHTYFKEIYDYFNSMVNIGRIRLIKSYPQFCLSWHHDNDDKIHIPIKTNNGVRMIVEDEVMHMPAGSTTIMRTNKNMHSTMNGGNEDRIHLVIPFSEK